MKKFINQLEKRAILLLLVLFVSSYATVTNAQIVSSSPTVSSKAVIHYEGYSKLWMKLSGVQNGQNVTIRSFSGQYNNSVTITNGEVLALIPEGEDFEVVTTDAIGTEVTLSRIKSYPDETQADMIEVSDELYAAIRQFQTMANPPKLVDFIAGTSGVNKYEKIGFIQQFFLGGGLLVIDDENMPDLDQYPLVVTTDNCLCKFVHKPRQNASPSENITADGEIIPKLELEYPGEAPSGGHREDYNDDSGWNWWRITKGAAKSNHMYSGGYKAGGTTQSAVYSVANSSQNSSPYRGQVNYNLVCENFDVQPKDCDCTKNMHIFYKYDTKISAYAKLRSAFQSKYGEAYCEDMALVSVTKNPGHENQETEILGAGSARVDARCERDPNPDFWISVLGVAESVVPFFLQDSSASPLDYINLIASVTTSLEELIGTPYYTANGCDNSGAVTEKTLVDGDKVIEFRSGDEIEINLFSFTNQQVGGKRSWESWADISSDFYLGAVALGNVNTGTDACCTTRSANWVYTSVDGGRPGRTYTAPLSITSIGSELGIKLAQWSWENLATHPATGGVILGQEVGTTLARVQCGGEEGDRPKIFGGRVFDPSTKIENVIDENLKEESNADKTLLTSKQGNTEELPAIQYNKSSLVSHIVIFDVMGRVMFNGKTSTSLGNLKSTIIDKGMVSYAGIYFVRVKLDTGESFTQKIFIAQE